MSKKSLKIEKKKKSEGGIQNSKYFGLLGFDLPPNWNLDFVHLPPNWILDF